MEAEECSLDEPGHGGQLVAVTQEQGRHTRSMGK